MKALVLAVALVLLPAAASACDGPVVVCDGADSDHFALVRDGVPATVYVAATAEKPVLRVAEDFADDLQRVSGTRPAVVHSLDGVKGDVVVIAEMGHTSADLTDASAIAGKWEAYEQTVGKLPDGRHILTIMGADKRGAIYGTYDISAKMGVSPWYWWADVPVAHKDNLMITDGQRSDAPVVKYRGFFINDEEPSFGGWAREKFGGINHQLYAKVFELDLRLKGNYLWPAMWGKSIADDDPESLNTADDYGIVLGTSHHEPMTRAQDEWHRHQDQGITGGAWDYTKNADNLRAFWRGGIERMVQGHHEDVVTVGMRGDGDEPMTEGTATRLLEQIVADQRKIIADVTGKPAEDTPQVWALYKEVQAYYDHGMKVPDDVTLLFSDDNWGNIRRLPDPTALKQRSGSATKMPPPRAGGYGVYYHYDYVGGPRNYKWINTNQIEKTWQQMDLAYESGADRLWIVNVGDIKPMEYPLSFFMDMAWNPKAMTPEALKAYPAQWAGQQFGPEHAQEIGEILTRCSQYNARRKPELLDADTYNLFAYDESGRVRKEFDDLVKATNAAGPFANDAEAAYAELVSYPVMASAIVNYMYQAVAYNHDAAAAGMPADSAAKDAQRWFQADANAALVYNTQIAGGKWNHMMDQTHIGYTGWQQPDQNTLPALATSTPVHGADFVIHVDGDTTVYTPSKPPHLVFGGKQPAGQVIHVSNRGDDKQVTLKVASSPDWLIFSGNSRDKVIFNGADYGLVSNSRTSATGELVLHPSVGADIHIPVEAKTWEGRPTGLSDAGAGYIAIEAEHYSRKYDGGGVSWLTVPNLGRTLSGVLTYPQAAPATAASVGVRLEYDFSLVEGADATLSLYLAPTIDTHGQGGLKLAVAMDDGPAQTLSFNLNPEDKASGWDQAVSDNIVVLKAAFPGLRAGRHTLKVFRIDGNVVLERLVLDTGGLKPSYLGPPESPAVP